MTSPSSLENSDFILNIVVIGAGTMGSGIAAHFANLGFRVTLVDSTPQLASNGLVRATKASPPAFYLSKTASTITTMGLDDASEAILNADWVCEAIYENLDAKRSLYRRIESLISPQAMFSTNTSGLEIDLLAKDLPDSLKKRFMGLHFFNPPRYLKLVEMIPGSETSPHELRRLARFLESSAGKRTVVAKDTPGFIANRFGMWSMFQAIHTTEKIGLTVEEADAITGPILGRPKSASFRLNDVVGLDVMRDIASNLIARCPNDRAMSVLQTPKSMGVLLEKGWLGEKTGHGYYRKEGKDILAFDLETHAYRIIREPRFNLEKSLLKLPIGERISILLKQKDEVGEFLRQHLIPGLQYANSIRDEISHNVQDFDEVMQWGFGWEKGPFQILDELDEDVLGLGSDSKKKFYQGHKVAGEGNKLVDKRTNPDYFSLDHFPVVSKSKFVTLRDLGDGITSVGITSKVGVIQPELVKELTDFFEKQKNGVFVFTSEAKAFSAGYNLDIFSQAIENGDFSSIEENLRNLQKLGEALEKVKVVAAIYGFCLGAGLELALSCPMVVSLAETKIGFPESKVGLLPGGRGTTLMRILRQENAKDACEAALYLGGGYVAQNAVEALQIGYLRSNDEIEFHPDRLIYRAKMAAIKIQKNEISTFRLPAWGSIGGPLLGMIDREISQKKVSGDFSDHDVLICEKIKSIFARSTSYEDALSKEIAEFVDLCKSPLTRIRIRSMLETGRPIRN